MKNRLLFFAMAMIATPMTLHAQVDWTRFDKLMGDGSYKSAYELAEERYRGSDVAAERLAAAYHMALAAANYQEDAYDSAKARYEELLPSLEPLEKALCHAFLGQYDSALAQADLLKQTPVERVKMYCEGGKTQNMTPTVYDLIVTEAQQKAGASPRRRVEWQQALVDFHAHDGDDIRLFHENRLLDMLAEVPNQPLTVECIQQSVESFRGTKSPWYTQLYRRLAEHYSAREDYVAVLRCCDTAIQLAPKSEGGVACANLKNEILQKRVEMNKSGLWVMPGRQSLQRVRYRNLDRLYYRIIGYTDTYSYGEQTRSRLLSAKVLASGQWSVVKGEEYRYAESYVSLPALATGRYLLLVSPSADFKADGFMAYEVNCTEMLLVQNGQEGLLLDRRTGHPIAGQEMRVERRLYDGKRNVLATAVTDADGRYRFDLANAGWGDQVVVERDGYRLNTRYYYNSNHSTATMQLRAELRCDRPIYRPGDTVQTAILCYRCDGMEAHTATGERLKVTFSDPNGEEVDTLQVATDDFGMSSVGFAIPTDRLAGSYTVRVMCGKDYLGEANIRVEEYKQPRFMVEMEAGSGVAPQFGVSYTVRGLAASYSAVPVSGARVHYTVVRRQLHRWWWRWWGIENETQVAEGELSTASDGSYSVVFTPEPDSTVELSGKPTFEFEVRVDVTDLNGESHEAVTRVRVGFCNAFISLEPGSTPGDLKIKHFDINGNPLPGEVKSRVELLHQPDVPLLDSPLLSDGVQQSMDETEWCKAFPMLAYGTAYNDMSRWPVAGRVESGERRVESGVYRITLSAEGADTVTEYLTYVAPDARKVPSQQLLWAELDRQKAEVGETVRLRIGSRFRDVEVYYLLRIGDEERDFRRIVLSDEIRTIDIPVDSSMLGGFRVDLVSVREGIEECWSKNVEVPFSHKRLKVDIATFRDKMLPGEHEEWTIKVESGERGEESALVMTMYDDALNSYGSKSSWDLSPWRSNFSRSVSPLHIGGGSGYWLTAYKHLYYQGSYPSVWNLKEALPHYSPWRGHRVYRTAMAKNSIQYEIVEDEAEEEAFAMNEPMAASMKDMADDAVVTEGGTGSADAGQPEVQVRTNLNTLAFFAPALRTDAEGTVSYRFTVPELLTRWNVRGLAVTKDIKTGTLDRTLVTSKPLMVQPNMPRFLRSGDSLALMAKVVLNEDLRNKNDDLPVEVSFLLTDAATGDTLCHHTESVTLHDVAQVSFPIEVPQNVYVATYKIVASGQWSDASYSDGEQGQVPVVTNRQAVTVSQALYINGAGEKHFGMPEWLVRSDTREPRLVAAEVTSNPIWLAIKCMPYLKSMENPSTLYLAHQLYVNSLGRELLGKVDLAEFVGHIEDNATSRLRMNEDVKQTLLKSTPWVQDADSEEEQMRAVANYFDTVALEAQLTTLCGQLDERQNADGGWSWMPDGQSSLWITQQVLQRVDRFDVDKSTGSRNNVSTYQRINTKQALAYIDREQQRHYEKYIKPYLKKGYSWTPTDIDYLYTRSFYGKASTEAYKFYYANALKHYREYGNLYTQAQLALIFHRHGDRKAALDLLRRLKEKSLTSDEMGMYWRDNRSGWFWYQRPIETQALLIQAFAEISPDDRQTIGLMQQWLLKQKQTTHWGNDAATTRAIAALLSGEWREESGERNEVELSVFGEPLSTLHSPHSTPEGYRSQRWTGDALDSLRALRSSDIVVRKQDDGIAWGSVYYQFTDDMDKIPSSDMGITVKRSYINLNNQNIPSNQSTPNTPIVPKVGDKLKVRIDIQCDRAMDYLELVDGRPSCVEPLSTRAGWRWNEGLSYYITVNNTDTRCYIEHLDKGKYWFEYEVYVTNPGQFLSGPVTMQCMYAPEFRATAPAVTLTVRP